MIKILKSIVIKLVERCLSYSLRFVLRFGSRHESKLSKVT